MGIFSNIFNAILGGVASSSERRDSERATREATREAGDQNRRTSAFDSATEYHYNQKLRDEKARALSSGYNQFSTVRQFAPGYVPGSGLDAVTPLPKPEDYD